MKDELKNEFMHYDEKEQVYSNFQLIKENLRDTGLMTRHLMIVSDSIENSIEMIERMLSTYKL